MAEVEAQWSRATQLQVPPDSRQAEAEAKAEENACPAGGSVSRPSRDPGALRSRRAVRESTPPVPVPRAGRTSPCHRRRCRSLQVDRTACRSTRPRHSCQIDSPSGSLQSEPSGATHLHWLTNWAPPPVAGFIMSGTHTSSSGHSPSHSGYEPPHSLGQSTSAQSLPSPWYVAPPATQLCSLCMVHSPLGQQHAPSTSRHSHWSTTCTPPPSVPFIMACTHS